MPLSAERHWFIYYRAPVAGQAEVVALVKAFQAGLVSRYAALAADLMQRPLVDDQAEVTFMETYRCNGMGLPVAAVTQLMAGAPGLATHLNGQRHVEEFLPCA